MTSEPQDPLANPKSVGPFAARLRARAKLSLRAVAAVLGITHPSLIKAEGGDPSMTDLALRAALYLLEHLTKEPVQSSETGPQLGAPHIALIAEIRDEEMTWRRVIALGLLSEFRLDYRLDGDVIIVKVPGVDYVVDLWKATWGPAGQDAAIPINPVLRPWHVADRDTWGKLLSVIRFLSAGKLSDQEAFDVFVDVTYNNE